MRLHRSSPYMLLAFRGLHPSGGTRFDPAVASVVADAVHVVVDHGGVVNVVNIGDIYIVHRTVVIEVPVVPTSALISVTEISEPVVDSAIETDLRTPVADMPDKRGSAPSPPSRSPQKADRRCQHPSSWHPVITVGAPSPIARHPYIARIWANWLRIDGYGRRPDRNRYTNLCRRNSGKDAEHECEQHQQTTSLQQSHRFFLLLGYPHIAGKISGCLWLTESSGIAS